VNGRDRAQGRGGRGRAPGNGWRERHARSFGGDVGAYARSRPGYPDRVVDWLVPTGARDVVDLGAGSGALTRSLVARGLAVTAVQPSESMRAALAKSLPAVPVVAGTAKSIPLPAASADAVLCAQAWHWVDPDRAGPEVARVLRPGGLLGLVWNDRTVTDEWSAELDRLVLAGQPGTPGGWRAPDAGPGFALARGPDVSWTQWLTPTGLVDLVASRSYVLVLDHRERADVLTRASGLAQRWAAAAGSDRLGVTYTTHSWRATRG